MKTYPKFIEVDNKRYPLNTSYKIALRCLEIIEDENINDTERSLAIIYLLLGDIPKSIDLERIQRLLVRYLQCGKENTEPNQNNAQEKDMDFIQDEKYIISSFMYDYKIDLSQEDMHWWKFIDLLDGLSSESILSRVRDIRTMDLTPYKDPKTRERLIKAKQQVALKHKRTKEEQEAIDAFEALFKKHGTNELDPDDEFLE